MQNLTVKDLITRIKKRDISITEAANFYSQAIKKQNKALNVYLWLNKDLAAQARALDEEFTAHAEPAFLGVPYAIKDNILVDNMPCTAASKMLENYQAPYDATVAAHLRQEGALVLGKTNMDEFAMGSSTENSAFGPTKNPHDVTRVPGGSSGGSAAAVAAGLAPFALGSDTGGSIRQPASFCGVVGFKPTYGAISRHGLIAMASSLDQIGPITQTVEDARLVFEQLIGRDELDATSLDLPTDVHVAGVKKLRIGVVSEYMDAADAKVCRSVMDAVDVYKKMGAQIQEVTLPHAEYGLAAYYIIMPSEVSSNLARYDGIRYPAKLSFFDRGANLAKLSSAEKRAQAATLLDEYLAVRGAGFGQEVRKRIMLGTYTLSSGYYDAYYLKAQKVRTLIAQDFARVFKDVDVIMCPTAPTLPFKLGERTKDSLAMYKSDLFTVGVNLAGLPALSVPVNPISEGGKNLPVGLQIIGKQQEDFTLLEVASWLERSI